MGHSQSPVVAVAASGPGALAGFESRCTCGLVIRSAFRGMAEADVREHAAYHAAKAASSNWADGAPSGDLSLRPSKELREYQRAFARRAR